MSKDNYVFTVLLVISNQPLYSIIQATIRPMSTLNVIIAWMYETKIIWFFSETNLIKTNAKLLYKVVDWNVHL